METNKIYCGDTLAILRTWPDECVNCCITSPKYNVGIEYDVCNDNMSRQDYEKWLEEAFGLVIKKLSPGGHLIIQIANTGRNPYIHLSGAISYLLRDKIRQVGEIIWNKQNTTNNTAWGSWLSANRPSLRDTHEYILVFRKDGDRKGVSDITSEEFMEYTLGIWEVAPETRAIGNHPAPYPEILTDRIIKLFTFKKGNCFRPILWVRDDVKICQKIRPPICRD